MISKKYSLILATLICFVLLCTGTALAATYSGGSGTIDDPYQLSSDSDIDNLSSDSGNWSSYFKLTNNITLQGNHTPIAPGDGFTGDFDGNGYVIKNLTIYETTNDYAGFFGSASSAANIHDLGIETSSDGVYSTINSVGILIGQNDGGNVSNCYATGNITGQEYVGGLVGYSYSYSTINNCYATVNVTGSSDTIGGLVGFNNGGSVSDSYSAGTVTGSSNTIGGLVGDNSGSVNNSYSAGTVSGVYDIGGLIGNNGGLISNCYATVNVTGTDYVGGLVGYNGNPISNCYATGTVSGVFYIGGLIGSNSESVTNSFATSTVSGDDYVGGFIGRNNGGTVDAYCYYSGSTGDDYATETSYENFTDYNFISGASGLNWNSDGNLITIQDDPNYVWRIIDCYTLPFFQYQEIDIDVPYSGGLGTTEHPYLLSTDADIDELSETPGNWSMNFALTNDITLTGNHAPIGINSTIPFTGDFNGNGYVIKNLTIYTEDFDTGFFGHTAASTNIHDLGIETSSEGVYSTNNRVGGLVGTNHGTISNCSATGSVIGEYFVGGLVGVNFFLVL